MEFKDRVANKPNRVKLTYEDGGASVYATVELADEPIEEGTALNAANMNKMLNKEDNDYIVEQGTSDIWSYRKWASGIAECWLEDKEIDFSTGGVTPETGINGLFLRWIDVSLPFAFTELPSAIASCRWRTTEFVECHAGTNTIRLRWFGVDTSFKHEPANKLKVSAQVKGRWK